MQKKNLVKNNTFIREMISKRMQELDFSQLDLINDAEYNDVKIDSASFSRYLKNENKDSKRSSLTEAQIIWICARLCIDIKIEVILMSYNPKQSKKMLDEIN